MRRHVILVGYKTTDKGLHVRLAIGCYSSAALTASGQHRALDEAVLALAYVTAVRQYDWVDEDDECVAYDAQVQGGPASKKRKVKKLEKDVEAIFNRLVGSIDNPAFQNTREFRAMKL
jgi:hypothetical protein